VGDVKLDADGCKRNRKGRSIANGVWGMGLSLILPRVGG